MLRSRLVLVQNLRIDGRIFLDGLHQGIYGIRVAVRGLRRELKLRALLLVRRYLDGLERQGLDLMYFELSFVEIFFSRFLSSEFSKVFQISGDAPLSLK